MAVPSDHARGLRSFVWITGIACPVILVFIVGIIWAGLGSTGARQHFLGQSTHTRATVVEDVEDGRCRRSGGHYYPEHHYTLEWSEGGEQRTEVIKRCGTPYEIGEDIEIWSTDGMPYTESAVARRLLIGGLVIAFSGLFALMLWVHVFVRRMARS
ncbi:hypothetical protein [Janibacter cremeus]|uniref:DUF3592 domain-containing protein n=1 Tax=Janibacter cremeus TaxID=1285192 RepID=A0A852VIM9_9MICO|nr:hypothetical protein [Janibacter cremeus]NYF96957.1 hypothetical protein [Janibacter cremeus]